MKANDLRPGVGVRIDGKLYVVVKTDHVKPGKGPAYVQAKLRDVKAGGIMEKRFNSSDTLEDAIFDRRKMEYLYSDSTGATFMDLETYDQIIVPEDVLGDALLYLAPNTEALVVCNDGNPISLDLPGAVDLVVDDTPPGIKGATATNQLKEATCETGLKTRVPPFIVSGEKIRVSTDDGSYLGRVKDEG